METSLVILGSGQDGGAPQMGDRTAVSRRRTASSAAVVSAEGSVLLLDVSPDIRVQSQMLLESPLYPKGRETLCDGLVITHAHMGHYAGLLHFGREAAATHKTPVYATDRFLTFMTDNEPWATLLTEGFLLPKVLDGSGVSVDQRLTIRGVPVPHRDELSDTIAISVEDRGEPWLLYVPDIDDWGLWPEAEQEIARHEIALIDATFSSTLELQTRDLSEIRHPLVTDSIARFRHLTTETRIVFTHINHSNPLGNESASITAAALAAGFDTAADELTYSRQDSR